LRCDQRTEIPLFFKEKRKNKFDASQKGKARIGGLNRPIPASSLPVRMRPGTATPIVLLSEPVGMGH